MGNYSIVGKNNHTCMVSYYRKLYYIMECRNKKICTSIRRKKEQSHHSIKNKEPIKKIDI